MFEEEAPDVPGYRVLGRLGGGGTGEVYLGEHEESGLEVAIKLLAPALARDTSAARRFAREAELLSGINHPNVVTLYEIGHLSDGTPFQVMEYLRGDDLSRMMARRERFAAEELGPYVQQICLGLHVAHERGVVHRDLKPGNILLLSTAPLRLKLIDFGAAKALGGDALTRENHVVGTPQFIAPELLRGAEVDRRVDIYSLGVLLYWMLAGHPPFRQETPLGLLQAHLQERPTSLRTLCPDLSGEVAWLVHRCLEKDPAQRPPSAKAVARAYLDALVRSGWSEPSDAFDAGQAWTTGVAATTRHRLEETEVASLAPNAHDERCDPERKTVIRREEPAVDEPPSRAELDPDETETKVRRPK